jgi:hypothetical protein
MKTVTVSLTFLASAVLAVTLSTAQSPAPAEASPSAPAPTAQKLDAVRATIILRTSLSSKNALSGKSIKAVLKRPVTLPNGEVLPRDTTFVGTVLASNKHSKEKPNGTFVLDFHEAQPKGHDPIQLIVRIKALAPAVEDEDASVSLPNSNGNMVALAGNSGGNAQVISQLNDRSNLNAKHLEASSIEGVHLLPSSQGAGAIFSLGEDVYLDPDVQMTVLLAPVPEKAR